MKVANEVLNILYQQLLEWFQTKALIFKENENYNFFYKTILEDYPEDFYPLETFSFQEILNLNAGNILLITPDNYLELRDLFTNFLFVGNKKEFYDLLNIFYEIKKTYKFKCLSCLQGLIQKKLKKDKECNCNGLRIKTLRELEDFLQSSKWIILSTENIFHLGERLNFFESKKRAIDNMFSKLKQIRNNPPFDIYPFDENKLEEILQNLESEIEISFTNLQKNFIKHYVKNNLVFIHGYPGSSKTFTGMLAILLDSYFKLKDKDKFNWLILAPTYEALLAAAENLFEFSRILRKTILRDKIINIILPWSRNSKAERILGFLTYQNLYYETLSGQEKKGGELYEEENLKIFRLNRKYFNLKAGEILYNGHLNVILDLPIAFIRYGFGEAKIIKDISFNGLHIEEASQFSILDLLMVLIANQGKFLEDLLRNPKEVKFSFSGDPYQLPSIFQIEDKIVKSKQVGPLFNLFSFFLKDIDPAKDRNIFVLKETYRCSTEIIIPVKGILYPDIISRRQEKGKILVKEYRISDKYKKSNKYEVELIEQILNKILERETNIGRVCILTPYRKQENLLKSLLSPYLDNLKEENKISKYTIGTVDKVQGATCDIVILSLTATDEQFIEANYSFLLEPSRLNVALTRAKKMFILIFHKNIYRLLTNYDIEYKHSLKMLLDRYKNTFFEDKTLEDFERIFKSWNPNIGAVILEKILLYSQKEEI